MRHTSRAIIIKDMKILLLTGHDTGIYWTPGGQIEEDESPVQALHREVKEELSANVSTYTHYFTYEYDCSNVFCYIVELSGDFTIANEITHFIWYAKGDSAMLSKGFESILLPRLIKDGLL